jgi:hypothetical protein
VEEGPETSKVIEFAFGVRCGVTIIGDSREFLGKIFWFAVGDDKELEEDGEGTKIVNAFLEARLFSKDEGD